MADVELQCNGTVHAGWEGMRISRSMEQCANSFELTVSELWPGQGTRYLIKPGDVCEVRLAGQVVISGYVDDVHLQLDANTHTVSIAGRDKAADLMDCSALAKGGQWHAQRVEAIAAALAAPFGIKVCVDVGTGKPLASFALQEGESAYDAIDRAARMRALLVVSDAKGGIVITRASNVRVATRLMLGVNVLQAEVKASLRDRYSRYIAKGQRSPALVFDNDATAQGARGAAQVRAEVLDAEVRRYRPLIITGECQDVDASLQQRVQWEANVRAARSAEVTVTVAGWSHASGLWEPNRLVPVDLPALGISGDLLIKSCRYSLGNEGKLTELVLTRRDAFTLLPLKPQEANTLRFDQPGPDRAASNAGRGGR